MEVHRPHPVALAFASTPSFEDARPQFEVIAQEMLANPEPDTLGDVQIGRLEASRVYDTPTEKVYFVDAREVLCGKESGWIYPPDHAPTEWESDLTTKQIENGWYEYQLVANY